MITKRSWCNRDGDIMGITYTDTETGEHESYSLELDEYDGSKEKFYELQERYENQNN